MENKTDAEIIVMLREQLAQAERDVIAEYSRGFDDGYSDGWSDGYTDGLAEGKRNALFDC